MKLVFEFKPQVSRRARTHRTCPQARQDLIDIAVYIGNDNVIAMERIMRRIEKRLRLLADFPHSGTQRPDLWPELRCVAVGNYILFFRPIEGGIELVRVMHGARDYESIFQKQRESQQES